MWKFANRAWNTALIPWRFFKTLLLLGTDGINTVAGLWKDAFSVIMNTNDKIAELFSDDLPWWKQALNIPVAAWVWITWVAELITKPIANWVVNTGKTAVNLGTNARKSTLWSLFTTNPVSDTRFNTIKWRGKKIHISTKEGVLSTEPWTKNWWYLSKEAELDRLREKERKIAARIAELTWTP